MHAYVCACVAEGVGGGLPVGVGDTCYCCSMGICHRNGMSCQTERPFPAVRPKHCEGLEPVLPGTTTVT